MAVGKRVFCCEPAKNSREKAGLKGELRFSCSACCMESADERVLLKQGKDIDQHHVRHAEAVTTFQIPQHLQQRGGKDRVNHQQLAPPLLSLWHHLMGKIERG
jgi:hypothetical protein